MLRVSSLLAVLLVLSGCSDCGGGGDPFVDLPVDQTLVLPNLEGPVEVLRDEWGVPHIYCQHDLDCIRAQGYIQAHDRLFEMDLFRNYGKGSLGTLFGANPIVREVDRHQRRLMSTRDDGSHVIDAIVEMLDADTMAYLEAFTEGVNAYIQDLDDNRAWAPSPDEYGFGLVLEGADLPARWEPRDTVAIGRLFTAMLSERVPEELDAGILATKFDAQTLSDFFPFEPLDPTFVLPDFYGGGQLGVPYRLPASARQRLTRSAPLMERMLAQRSPLHDLFRAGGEYPGSNNWIVAADKSATGNPLVMNDPHLPLWAPAVWHEVHIDSVSLKGADGRLKGRGVAFPGTPGVVIGHTDSISWGVTTVGYDVSDLYVEEVTGVDTVRFRGSDVAVVKATVQFPRGPLPEDGFDEEKVCIVPHHGPIWIADGFTDDELADTDLPCVDPARGTQAISGRWMGMEPTNELGAFRQFMLAQSVDEALTAWTEFEVGAQNVIIADKAGRIAYFPHATVPIRSGDLTLAPPWMPMPGDGTYEWDGSIPADELPQAVDPARGFVVTANNDLAGVTADNNPLNDTHYLFPTRDLGPRAGRITRLLEAAIADDGVADLEEMRAIQTDSYSEMGETLLPHLLAAADARSDLVTSLGVGDAIARLRQWSFEQPTGLTGTDPESGLVASTDQLADAIAASIFGAWFYNAIERTFHDEWLAAEAATANDDPRIDQYAQKALYFALERDRDVYFDDVSTDTVVETREEILLGALADAVTELESRLGTDPDRWVWGRLHHLVSQSIFGVFGLPNEFDVGPFANVGGLHTVNVANYDRSFQQYNGPSVRMVTDYGETPQLVQVIPGGTIDYLDHPNRADQFEMFLAGEYREIGYTIEASLAGASARAEAGTDPGARWRFVAELE